MGFVAALSGFRSLVADLLYIQAHTAWERTEWGRMKLTLRCRHRTAAALLSCFGTWRPWHMAYNASVAALEDPNQPREALRVKAQREYWKLGEEFLLRGIAQ